MRKMMPITLPKNFRMAAIVHPRVDLSEAASGPKPQAPGDSTNGREAALFHLRRPFTAAYGPRAHILAAMLCSSAPTASA